jgi:RNA polymerase sigma factor (sigma-70 family)
VEMVTSTPSEEQLQLLSQVVRDVARSRRLPAEDAQDFAQSVHLTLLERRYDVFARYGGRSSLRTFLTAVVRRMLLDWRNQAYGKWRASAAALRLGAHAVTLERLIYRDGHPPDEAIALAAAAPDAPSADCLLALRGQIPVRHRRRMVSEDALREVSDPNDGPAARDSQETADRHTRRAIAAALRELSPEDRWLIAMRYGHGRSVQALAAELQVDSRALYRRYTRVLRSLRRAAGPADRSRDGQRRKGGRQDGRTAGAPAC